MVAPAVSSREASIWSALEAVTDPEIPVLSIVEMGMIAAVRCEDHGVVIDLTPTFVGCPAIDVIRAEIENALRRIGETGVIVNVVYEPAWTSDRISPQGRQKLKAFGLAPPGPSCRGGTMPVLQPARCPYCNSENTVLDSLFGPTLCRAIHYCHNCRQSFEEFKAV